MITKIRVWLALWRLRRAPLNEFHDEIRNGGKYLAIRRDRGVVYVPKSRATAEEQAQAMSQLELAAWQRGVEKRRDER